MSQTKIVERVLQQQRQARSNDKLLMLAVWEQQGLYLNDHQRKKFMKCMTSETITRIRRKLQEHGQYSATPEVEQLRYEKFKEVRASAPRAATPDQMGLV